MEKVDKSKKEFYLRVHDKYHRGTLSYNYDLGFYYALLTHGENKEKIRSLVSLPPEEYNTIYGLIGPLERDALFRGHSIPKDEAQTRIELKAGFYQLLYLDNDPTAYEKVQEIEKYLFERYPELKELMDKSKLVVAQEEEEARLAKEEEARKERLRIQSLTMQDLKDRYPTLFGEDGTLTGEAINMIIESIDRVFPGLIVYDINPEYNAAPRQKKLEN